MAQLFYQWADRRIREIEHAPEKHGTPEGVEAQYLTALEVLLLAKGHDDPHEVIARAYAEQHKRHPMVGSAVPFWCVAGYQPDEFGSRHYAKHNYQNVLADMRGVKEIALAVPVPVPDSGFERALEQAQEALTHIGTGELKATELVHEGPRSYAKTQKDD